MARIKNLARTTIAARRAAVRYAMQHRFLGSRKAIEYYLMEIASDAFIATFARACREQRPISVEMMLTAAMGQHNTAMVRQSQVPQRIPNPNKLTEHAMRRLPKYQQREINEYGKVA